MKHKNSDLPSYWILTLFGVILTACIIIYIKGFFDTTKDVSDSLVAKTESITGDIKEYDITMYAGETLQGSEVINYIKKNLGQYSDSEAAPVFIRVRKSVSGTTYTNDYINKEHIEDIKNVSALDYYIKPTSQFYCEIIQNENKVILGISFTQQ